MFRRFRSLEFLNFILCSRRSEAFSAVGMASLSDISDNISKLIQQHIRASISDLIPRTLQTLTLVNELISKDSLVHANNGGIPEIIMTAPSNGNLNPDAAAIPDGNLNPNLEVTLISGLQPSSAAGRGFTYKQALSPPNEDFRSDMQASRKGEFYFVKIDNSLVQKEIDILKNSLIGRISMAPGDNPYALDDLKCKLE